LTIEKISEFRNLSFHQLTKTRDLDQKVTQFQIIPLLDLFERHVEVFATQGGERTLTIADDSGAAPIIWTHQSKLPKSITILVLEHLAKVKAFCEVKLITIKLEPMLWHAGVISENKV
jgi:hypothetical protein